MISLPFQSVVSSAPSQSPPTSSSTGMAVTGSAPPGAGSPPTAPTAQRCCDTGRPLFTDPLTGQTVCSCQYDLLGYQRLAGGVPGIPALSMYSAPYPEGMAAYFPALGADQPPFYTSTVSKAYLNIHESKLIEKSERNITYSYIS